MHHPTFLQRPSIEDMLIHLIEREKIMSAALDRITQVVNDTKASMDAAVAKINDLSAQIANGGSANDDALNSLSDALSAAQAALDAAVNAQQS